MRTSYRVYRSAIPVQVGTVMWGSGEYGELRGEGWGDEYGRPMPIGPAHATQDEARAYALATDRLGDVAPLGLAIVEEQAEMREILGWEGPVTVSGRVVGVP